jgi:phage repressor protein C with HTH and peptisase S24 domain
MEALSLSQAELARRLGLAQPTIAKLLSGQSRSSTHMHRIARALATTPEFLTGETDDPNEGAVPLPTLETMLEQFGQVMIPLLHLPTRTDEMSAPKAYEPFRRTRLEPLMLGSFSDLFAFEMRGDTMLPVLKHGSVCIADSAQTRIVTQDDLWVLEMAGSYTVRRVRRDAKGRYEVLADNFALGDLIVEPFAMNVIGRVIWRGDSI